MKGHFILTLKNGKEKHFYYYANAIKRAFLEGYSIMEIDKMIKPFG